MKLIKIGVRHCKCNGIDCRVHAINIECFHNTNERAASSEDFEYLAVTSSLRMNDTTATEVNSIADIRNTDNDSRVFVWGLNDKGQLGGCKGSKVNINLLNVS